MNLRPFIRCALVTVSTSLVACGAPAPKASIAVPAPLTAPAQVDSRKGEAIARPTLQIGQTWTYRRTDLWRNQVMERFEQELWNRDGERWTVQWRITDSVDPTRRGSVTGEYLDAATLAFFDPKVEGRHEPLRFPLLPGKRWSFNYVYNALPGRVIRIDQRALVVGWETVSVPAGRFRALKVVHEGDYFATEQIHSWSGKIREIYWYAPDARRVVRMEYSDTRNDGSPHDHWCDELVAMKL